MLLICVWAIVVVFGFVIVRPRLPFALAIAVASVVRWLEYYSI
jgi:hypothetical protein